MELEYQTASEEGCLKFFTSFSDAWQEAMLNKTVYKISWSEIVGEKTTRIRLLRNGEDNNWALDLITPEDGEKQAEQILALLRQKMN
jgi:hypothetical protein